MFLRNSLFVLGVLTLLSGLTLAVIWMRLPETISQPVPETVSDETQSATQPAQPSVLVAAVDVPQGTLLRSDQIAWKQIPQSQILPIWIVRGKAASEAYLGAVTRRGFVAGEPLVPNGLVRAGERNFLAAVLAPGMKAVSLSVDVSQVAAGLIEPGDHVDVILAQNVGGSSVAMSTVGETVLRNLRVVAVDQWFTGTKRPVGQTGPLGSARSASIPKTVTFEATEDDAKRLLVAAQLGRVTLALRALEGSYLATAHLIEGAEPVWAADVSPVLGGRHKTKAGSGAPAAPAVRILRGSKGEGS